MFELPASRLSAAEDQFEADRCRATHRRYQRACDVLERSRVERSVLLAHVYREAGYLTAASASISSVAPSLRADCVCSSIQYGHWVASATATAINCLLHHCARRKCRFVERPECLHCVGGIVIKVLEFARFEMLYTALSPREIGIKMSRRADPTKSTRDTRCLVSPYAQWPVDYRSNCDEPLCLKVTT
jgi:hypothetical protein